MIQQVRLLRFFVVLCLLFFGNVQTWADDVTNSGNSSSNAEEDTEELVYDFTTSEGKALIAGLASGQTGMNANNKNLTIQINGYDILFHNCLRGSSYLRIRGDYSDTNVGKDPGYLRGSMSGTLTAVKIAKQNGATSSGNVTIEIVDQDGKLYEVNSSETLSAAKEYTISIPTEYQIQNAKSISVKPDFDLRASKITMVRIPLPLDTSKDLVIFKKKNGAAYPSIKDDETVYEAPNGQILQLQSLDAERFDPISSTNNPYVVTYTVDGVTTPQFDHNISNGNWKDVKKTADDGNTTYSYIYRRGIVLDGNSGNIVTIKVSIFKIDKNGSKGTLEKPLQTITKKFKLVEPTTYRPQWKNQKDIHFTPRTIHATNSSGYVSGMAVMDPTETVTALASSICINDTIIAKYSQGTTTYDLQSLLNAANVTPRLRQANMTSSQMKQRKISAMLFTTDGLAIDKVAEAYYWYIPARQKLNLEATVTPNELSIAEGSTTKNGTINLKGYYTTDDNTKTYIDMTKLNLTKDNIKFGDSEVAALLTGDGVQTITYSEDEQTAYIHIEGKDNGTTDVTIQTLKTSNITGDGSGSEEMNFTVASVTTQVTVKDGDKIVPPSITPYSQDYNRDFKATVTGYEGVKTYYILHYNPTQSQDIPTTVSDDDSGDTTGGETSGGNGIESLKDRGFIDAAESYINTPDPNGEFTSGMIEGANSAALNIFSGIGKHYTLYAMAVKEETNDGTTTKTYSRVINSDYTYNTLEAPVLSPGILGENNHYDFEGELTVEAHVDTPNTLIFYTTDRKATFTAKDGNIVATANAWTIYDASKRITVNKSMYVRAVAFNDSLRLASDIVEYRYSQVSTDIEAPTFSINGTTYQSGSKYTGTASPITIQAKYYDAEGNQHVLGGTDNATSDKYRIYYTTDGSNPDINSHQYTGAFTPTLSNDVTEIIACVIAVGTDGTEESISDYSSLFLFKSNNLYWETNESTCPDGKLSKKSWTLSQGTITLMNFEFGGTDTDKGESTWKHYVSREHATGEPIDNVGYYTITPADDTQEKIADVRDEQGDLWNHSKTYNSIVSDFQTHKATFGLPASGAYVKFEPKQNGTLTIWCCQEGALYYNNNIDPDKSKFNSLFLRKRPVYFIDEAGKSMLPKSVYAAGTLSSNWDNAKAQGVWIPKGETQNGILQDLYTEAQTEQIYNMFNEVILNKNADYKTSLNDLIIYLHTANDTNSKVDKELVAGYNVAEEPLAEGTDAKAKDENLDGTGICLPSASYMKYTFNVKAGKTYFFFGWMTKVGIRGFGFEPSTSTESLGNEVTLYSGKGGSGTSADEFGDSKDNTDIINKCQNMTYNKVKLMRNFTGGHWTTLVLPFSVSASELQQAFGTDAKVLHYRTIEGRTMYFYQHYHQMIVAGTPILVKPVQTVKNPEFHNVTFESTSVIDKLCNDYGFKTTNGISNDNTDFQMIGSYVPQTYYEGDYYMAKDGTVKYLSGKASSTLQGTRAYIKGTKSDGTQVQIVNMAKAAYNHPDPIGMNDEATDIDFIDNNGNAHPVLGDGKVYNINGQLVRKSGQNLNGLAKGVYIANGKKIVIK